MAAGTCMGRRWGGGAPQTCSLAWRTWRSARRTSTPSAMWLSMGSSWEKGCPRLGGQRWRCGLAPLSTHRPRSACAHCPHLD
jgi:hypothetical protein